MISKRKLYNKLFHTFYLISAKEKEGTISEIWKWVIIQYYSICPVNNREQRF